jgi:NADH-quinone oxidoreductase subunit I
MMNKDSYIGGLLCGIRSLLVGMKTSMKVFWEKPATEQYPENRRTLKISERFRGSLYMPLDEQGNNRCIACNLCQMACPNDTIRIAADTVETADGKKKKVLVRYEYDLGSCMFCQLCVNACPHDAIRFDNTFEHAVFDRNKLFLTLNKQSYDI